MRDTFFDAAGLPRTAACDALARDVSRLFLPSADRARSLNKAYWSIVREQSFSDGRAAILAPLTRVYREIAAGSATGIERAETAPGLALQ
ncbi:MAG TPA: hypothetical protein VJR89_16485 [Polyangiales bacterium]|nr:hypothetical protein [Polyangiales bacterium]